MNQTQNKKPLISVIMPVYNAGKFLGTAIESILNQTYDNFEFIIVNDGSTDNSWHIIQKYAQQDKRLKTYQNNKNLGVSATTNLAIAKTKGKYIARMDADDISFPDRLEKQIKFLSKNPNIIAVGGQCVVIDKKNQVIGNKTFPTNPEKLKEMIFQAVPIQQPSIMINTSLLPKNFKWYSPTCSSAEELDVLFKLMKYGKLANLKDNILKYRYLPTSLSHKNPKQTFWFTLKSRVKAVKQGFYPTPRAILINLAQVFVVALLPNQLITKLWYLLRGINQTQIENQNLSPVPALS